MIISFFAAKLYGLSFTMISTGHLRMIHHLKLRFIHLKLQVRVAGN